MMGSTSSKSTLPFMSLSGTAFSPTRIQATSVRIAIVIVAVLASMFIEGFATTQNLSSILFSTVSVGIAACGLALITISGNLFMLSISATTSISTIIFASALPFGIPTAVIVTLAVGIIFGVIQGTAVGVMKTNPIV